MDDMPQNSGTAGRRVAAHLQPGKLGSTRPERHEMAPPDNANPSWKGHYRAGAIAAVLAAAVFRRNWGAEAYLLRTLGIIRIGPASTPASAADWFDLLQSSPILGLILLNIVDVVNYALVGLILLALFAALRQTSQSAVTIGVACGFIGIALCFASNQAFGMLALSDRYAAATTGAQQSTFLAAGEALLAFDNPGSSYPSAGVALSLFLVTLANLLASIMMLPADVFSKTTAWVGIAAHGIGLGYFVALAFAPGLVAIPPSISALFLLAWNIMVARRLFQLARDH